MFTKNIGKALLCQELFILFELSAITEEGTSEATKSSRFLYSFQKGEKGNLQNANEFLLNENNAFG